MSKELRKIKKAAEIIRNGGVVVFPTETVYGLGADAFNEKAVKKIFSLKGRDEKKPLTLHISKFSDIKKIARNIPKRAMKLAKKYWPGPLTIILYKKRSIPDIVTASRKTVGIRMPDHPVALSLIYHSRTLIAAPSANISGKKSPASIAEIPEKILHSADYILNSGRCRLGISSTVIDFTRKTPEITRRGAIPPLNHINNLL